MPRLRGGTARNVQHVEFIGQSLSINKIRMAHGGGEPYNDVSFRLRSPFCLSGKRTARRTTTDSAYISRLSIEKFARVNAALLTWFDAWSQWLLAVHIKDITLRNCWALLRRLLNDKDSLIDDVGKLGADLGEYTSKCKLRFSIFM